MAKILVAASAEPRSVLERVLAGHELCCAETVAQAELLLRKSAFDLIICTVIFDESRMFDLLRSVRATPEWQGIPFVCARVRTHILDSRLALEAIAFTCRALGAVSFLDIADYKVDAEARNAGCDRAASLHNSHETSPQPLSIPPGLCCAPGH